MTPGKLYRNISERSFCMRGIVDPVLCNIEQNETLLLMSLRPLGETYRHAIEITFLYKGRVVLNRIDNLISLENGFEEIK